VKDKDIRINRNCVIRRNADDTYGDKLHIRLAEPYGGHGEATNLTVAEAIKLRAELDAFITGNARVSP
jgi:hypothetical protein